MILKHFANKLIDALFACSFVEQNAFFIEDGAVWRETVSHCRRCGKVDTISQNIVDNNEFWEADSLYCLNLEPQEM